MKSLMLLLLLLLMTYTHSFASERIILPDFSGFYTTKDKAYYKELMLTSVITKHLESAPVFFLTNYFKYSPLALMTQPEITTLANLQNNELSYSNENDFNISNKLMLVFLAVILIIILFFLYRQYNLKQINKILNIKILEEMNKSRQKDQTIFQQNKLISIGEMLENIGHQWRQPLSQVNSAVLIIDDILHQKNIQDFTIEEKLLEIESLTKDMSKTIDDFRTFFNPNKEKEKASFFNVIEKFVYIVEGTLKLHHIDLDIHCDKKYIFYGYLNELQQVLIIIFNNAKDIFLTRNILRPKINIEVQKNDNDYIISISDNGGGIKNDIIEKMFEPYFTTKHKSQGTGLSLYISKVIIEEKMGGTLQVKNIKNGACFEIYLKTELS